MDDAPMNHALDASSIPESEFKELETAKIQPARLASLPWDSYIRCLFLLAILGAVGYMAWRPAKLRVSILMSMVSPSRGDSLAWQPPPETAQYLPPAKRTSPPDEWRLRATHASAWMITRPEGAFAAWRGGRMSRARWQRFSYNPWRWQADVSRDRRRDEELAGLPLQKPATGFRSVASGIAPAVAFAAATTTPEGDNETPPMVSIPPLEQPSAPETVNLAVADAEATPPAESESVSASEPEPTEAPQLAALPQSAADPEPEEETKAAPRTVLTIEPIASPESDRKNEASTDSVADSLSPAGLPIIASSSPVTPTPTETPSLPEPEAATATEPVSPTAAPDIQEPERPEPEAVEAKQPDARPEPVFAAPEQPADAEQDWKNTAITETIPGAYLTIYPKLRFIGLCVPGQGYVRNYSEVAVPGDLLSPKQRGDDGRTPYGRYYVAGRQRDGGGPRLFISWPSPEDARRLGLDPAVTARVDDAWQNHALPPQDSVAGGGVAIVARDGGTTGTLGGFALEGSQIEELFTALPDGAWIFIQE